MEIESLERFGWGAEGAEGEDCEGVRERGRRGVGLAASFIRSRIFLTRDPTQLVMVVTIPLLLSVELEEER